MPPEGSNVRFEDQGEEFGRPPEERRGIDLAGRLVEWGIVSSPDQAQYVLIGISAVALLVSVYLFFFF